MNEVSPWNELRRRRRQIKLALVAGPVAVFVLSEFLIGPIVGFLGRLGLQEQLAPIVVLPLLAPAIYLAVKLRRFVCPACGQLFHRHTTFRLTCARCGATPTYSG